MLDLDRERSVRVLQLYLTTKEATELRDGLSKLLKDAEGNNHDHVFAEDMSREMSFSIVTDSKLKSGGYTALERRIFDEQ